MVRIPKRNRAFTLIEMIVVIVILAFVSVGVEPYLVAMRDSQARRGFYTGAADFGGQAREMALSMNVTTYLQADASQNAILIKEEVQTSNYQANSNGATNVTPGTETQVVNGKVESTRTMNNIGTATMDSTNDKTLRTLPLPAGMQFGNFTLSGTASDAGSWRVHFYADGTSDSGGVELSDKGYMKTLVVNSHGGVQVMEGSMPDLSQEHWQAGDYVHRQLQ